MISQLKADARKAGFARRKLAHEAGGAERAQAHLLTYIKGLDRPLAISGYMPIRTEIDVLPAMHDLAALGHQICVPVIVAAGMPLSFREWTPECTMKAGAFGASIPEEGEWIAPELLIVPLVAFDNSGYRLGYGGGFYDRSLELLRKKRPTLAVGFAYSGQMGDVPVEPTDQRLDAMVTEHGIVQFT